MTLTYTIVKYIEPILMYRYYKTATKETGGNRNVVLVENASKLMDC